MTDDFKGLREAVRRHRAKKDCEFDINDIAALLAELDRVRGERDAIKEALDVTKHTPTIRSITDAYAAYLGIGKARGKGKEG